MKLYLMLILFLAAAVAQATKPPSCSQELATAAGVYLPQNNEEYNILGFAENPRGGHLYQVQELSAYGSQSHFLRGFLAKKSEAAHELHYGIFSNKVLQFAGVSAMNENLKAAREKGLLPNNGLSFVLFPDAEKVDELDVIKHLARREIIVGGKGGLYFHDLMLHGVVYANLDVEAADTTVQIAGLFQAVINKFFNGSLRDENGEIKKGEFAAQLHYLITSWVGNLDIDNSLIGDGLFKETEKSRIVSALERGFAYTQQHRVEQLKQNLLYLSAYKDSIPGWFKDWSWNKFKNLVQDYRIDATPEAVVKDHIYSAVGR